MRTSTTATPPASTAAIAARKVATRSSPRSIGPNPMAPWARASAAMSMSGSVIRWPIHLFSIGLPRARHTLLVHLVVVEGSIVRNNNEQRDAIVHRGPNCGRTHQEVAIAADPDRQACAVA